MAATAVPYLVAGVLQIKRLAYTDRTSLSFRIRGNAVPTKQMCKHKSKSGAPSDLSSSPSEALQLTVTRFCKIHYRDFFFFFFFSYNVRALWVQQVQ